MDPNAALTAIHEGIAEFNLPDTDSDDYLPAVDQIIDSFKALDEWLGRGGFLPAAWDRNGNDALAALMTDWIKAQCSIIAEVSSSITEDQQRLVDVARERADLIGLTWTDSLVPEHVRYALGWDKDHASTSGDVHPDWPVEDWRHQVANEVTRQSYSEWVQSQIEAERS